ncbi:glycosyltransferase family 2 protein [Tropicimonas sp. IMCC34011]|uniref:glycosyltransferase n=1 Tax=Tropicimonas sp. IMCC34011 TaxID=2248759 RepID=UPI000E251238|nr:glycosyltransferase family A protein [Tropicimonas sp. IMCC34011]
MTSLHLPPGWGASGLIVAIPARNEASRLPFALSALCRGTNVDVIVIANGCTDDTVRIAHAFTDLPVAVLDAGNLPNGVGEARRLGMEVALKAAPRASILATTDADCTVMPGWAQCVRKGLQVADVVCGRVVPDPAEFARLPDMVQHHGMLEDAVAALQAELDGLQAPSPHDPLPRHGQTPGASLAFRTGTYLSAGGFSAIPCHEDRKIITRIEALGGRIARPWNLVVTASCRLTGRAPGGMAATILARAADPAQLAREITQMRGLRDQLHVAIARLQSQEGGGGKSEVCAIPAPN